MKQRYDSYKPSGVDWIGEIPSHWEVCKLKHHITIDSGDFISKEEISEDADNPVYGGGEVIGFTDKYNVSEYSIIIGRVGARCGCVTPVKCKTWATDNSLVCIPKDNFGYITHLLFSANLNRLNESNAQPLITATKVKNLLVPIPSLAEQQAIASWLDEKCGEIDAAVAKVDHEIELIDELKQSEISRVVTRGLNPNVRLRPSGIDWIGNIPENWKVVPIKSQGGFIKGLTFTKADLVEDGYPVISYGQIHSLLNNRIGLKNELLRHVPYSLLVPTAKVPKGSFIFADTSEDLDGCGNAVYNDSDSELYAGYHTIIFRANTNWNKYLGYLFLTDLWRCQIRKSVSGVKVYSITQGIISSTSVLLPPLSEQREIADYLDKKCVEIDGLKAKLTQKREKLLELRQSLISEVVTGKRKVV